MSRQLRRESPLRTILLSAASAALILGTAWYSASSQESGSGNGERDGVESFVPRTASQIIERLSREARASKLDLKERMTRSAGEPPSVDSAVTLARRHYDRARQAGEPRELGLAQSALARWWDLPDAPVPVLLIRAAIRQHQHDFDGALADLERVVGEEPRNIQAWLSLAAIQQTTGRLKQAAASCRRAVEISDHVAGHVCLADLASLEGDPQAFERIERRLRNLRMAPSEGGWILTVMAEMAERLGRAKDAEELFRAAVARSDGSYAGVAYADFLLRKERASEVEAVLKAAPETDAVLLRRALAFERSGDPRAQAVIGELRRRFESSRGRSESLHLREMARFALELEKDPVAALALAQRNWVLQKEPADALLLAAAAKAAGAPEAAAPVRDFRRDPGLFDVRLDALL